MASSIVVDCKTHVIDNTQVSHKRERCIDGQFHREMSNFTAGHLVSSQCCRSVGCSNESNLSSEHIKK